MLRPLSDDYSLRECLSDTLKVLNDPARAAEHAQLAVAFLTANAEALDKAAEADVLLDMLQDPAVGEFGVGILLPDDVLDEAERVGTDPYSRQILWKTVESIAPLMSEDDAG